MKVRQSSNENNTHITGTWGKFARRFYFNSGRCREETQTQDSIWFYVAISALYFCLIAVILLVLLLAPKYKPGPSTSGSSTPVIFHDTEAPHDLPLSDISDAESDYFPITESRDSEAYLEVPRDPLYDLEIDPRSPSYSANQKTQNDYYDGRARINSKFFQD